MMDEVVWVAPGAVVRFVDERYLPLLTVPPEELEVGHWYAYCLCGEPGELEQITDEPLLREIREARVEEPGIVEATFRTREDALRLGPAGWSA